MLLLQHFTISVKMHRCQLKHETELFGVFCMQVLQQRPVDMMVSTMLTGVCLSVLKISNQIIL